MTGPTRCLRTLTWATPLAVALVSATARSAAAAEPVSLAWSAPASCPSRDAVLADMDAILGGPTSHHATAHAEVKQLATERWTVQVTTEVDGAPGERTLEADSCESLVKATALILAWAVDPVRAQAASVDAEPSPTPVAAPRETLAGATSPPPATTPSPNRVSWLVEAGGAGDVGMFPSAGLAAQIGFGALIGPVRLEIAGDDWMAQDATGTSNDTVVGARLHIVDGSLRGCLRGRILPTLELDPCAAAALEHATSTGIQGTSTTFQPYAPARSGDWISLHADVLAVWRLVGPLGLRGSLGLEAAPTRPSFTVDEPPQGTGSLFLHRPSLFGPTATLGVEARFP